VKASVVWSRFLVIALGPALLSLSPCAAEESNPSPREIQQLLEDAHRELSKLLAERAARREGEDPSTTGSIAMPAPIGKEEARAERLLFDARPMAPVQPLSTVPIARHELELPAVNVPNVAAVETAPEIPPTPAGNAVPPHASDPALQTAAIPNEGAPSQLNKPVVAHPKAHRQISRRAPVQASSTSAAPPNVIVGFGEALATVGHKVSSSLRCLGNTGCRVSEQAVGTVVGAAAGGAVGAVAAAPSSPLRKIFRHKPR